MLTIATLNINNYENHWLERRELLIAEILNLQPDLLALQEVRISAGQAGWVCSQLNARLGQQHYHLVQQRRSRWWRSGRDGVAIISRLPMLAHDAVSLGYDGCVALRANIELPTGYMVDVVSTHLHRPWRQPEVREEQMMKIVGWLNDRGGASHQIIAGSLNEIPNGMAIAYVKQQYLSAYAAVHGREPMATWPTAMIRSENDWAGCLDYIFVNHAFKVISTRLICTTPHPENDTLYPSDHVGLLTQLQLRPSA